MRYEKLAGRAGMVGASTALALELLFFDQSGVFGGISAAQLAGAALVLAAAAGLAAASRRRTGTALLEPLLAALTSSSGSASSAKNIDLALDALFDSVFSSAFLAVAFGPLLEDDSAAAATPVPAREQQAQRQQ